jgi:hypothetical protein
LAGIEDRFVVVYPLSGPEQLAALQAGLSKGIIPPGPLDRKPSPQTVPIIPAHENDFRRRSSRGHNSRAYRLWQRVQDRPSNERIRHGLRMAVKHAENIVRKASRKHVPVNGATSIWECSPDSIAVARPMKVFCHRQQRKPICPLSGRRETDWRHSLASGAGRDREKGHVTQAARTGDCLARNLR